MSQLLFTVEDRFQIRGRGVIVVPGIPLQDDTRIRIGDPILLKRPDGSSLSWTIGGLEMFLEQPYRPRHKHPVPILLVGLEKADVPIGTEIWSVDSAASS